MTAADWRHEQPVKRVFGATRVGRPSALRLSRPTGDGSSHPRHAVWQLRLHVTPRLMVHHRIVMPLARKQIVQRLLVYSMCRS